MSFSEAESTSQREAFRATCRTSILREQSSRSPKKSSRTRSTLSTSERSRKLGSVASPTSSTSTRLVKHDAPKPIRSACDNINGWPFFFIIIYQKIHHIKESEAVIILFNLYNRSLKTKRGSSHFSRPADKDCPDEAVRWILIIIGRAPSKARRQAWVTCDYQSNPSELSSRAG